MAGRVQLETVGISDRYFTDDPEYTYWRKVFRKHGAYAKETVTLDPDEPGDFGKKVKFRIPVNQGDVLTNVALRMKLPAIARQNLGTGNTRYGYIESVGHALIESVELFIGDIPVQRLTSDWLTIYSEHYFTQTKQTALKNLVGKYAVRSAATPVSSSTILYDTLNTYYNLSGADKSVADAVRPGANKVQEFLVDIPFYFYRNPTLSLPLAALHKERDITVEVKLRDYAPLVVALDTNTFAIRPTITESDDNQPMALTDLKMEVDVAFVDRAEVVRLRNTPMDMVFTQIQTQKSSVPASSAYDDPLTLHRMKLEFQHPTKELYFVIQREDNEGLVDHCTPLDYDNYNVSYSGNGYGKYHDGRLVLYEHLDYLTLKFDDQVILSDVTGKGITFLKAVQGGIHHSKTQLIRRFYSYAFGTEPEKPYPTGQVNLSLVKEQLLDMSLFPSEHRREVRVYALSYNVLRIVGGKCRTLFDDRR